MKQRYSAGNEITCEVTGPVRIPGMEDSNPQNIKSFKDNKQHPYHGKLLIYLQSLDKSGKAVIILSLTGLQGATVEPHVVKKIFYPQRLFKWTASAEFLHRSFSEGVSPE
jgi:hypothetical protein